MAVAKTIEISATSSKGFEDAVKQGVDEACKTLRNVVGAWVQDHEVRVEGGQVVEYKVRLRVTFVLD